jgi:streptogramin lyase
MKAPSIMKKIIFTNLLTAIVAFQVTGLFAATPVIQCDTSTPVKMVNTCAPEVTLNVASTEEVFDAIKTASVQSSVVASLFDTSRVPIVKIVKSGATSHQSFYGVSKPSVFGGKSKRVQVNITNWPNSSSVGISQLLTSRSIAIAGYPNNAFYGFAPPAKNVANTCLQDAASTDQAPILNCPSTSVSYKPNLVLSHVHPTEYQALNIPVTGSLGKLSITQSIPTFMAGFGVAVNESFYRALQGQNILDGVLPPSCSVGDMTGVCQPSIKQAQLASLISKDGGVKASSDLIPGDTTVLFLTQTVVSHSQKAVQNLLLLNNPCGLTTNIDKLNAALAPVGSADSTGQLQIKEIHQSNDEVGTYISSGAGYQIGLQPLSSNGLFIKLDASSPNFDINGQASYQNRTQTANGLNPLATMTYSVRMVKEDANIAAAANIFWLTLQSSERSDIKGLAYLDGATDSSTTPKQSKVQRIQNTNCSPLMHYKNTAVINPPSQPSSTTPPTPPTATSYSISGVLSGLPNGQSLTLINNSNDIITVSANGNFIFNNSLLTVSANGNFIFNNSLPTNSNYAVTLSSIPSGYICNVQNGAGRVSNSNVNNISVVCSALPADIFYNSSNGSYYKRVTAKGITWQQAKAAAEQSSFNGMQGYLATVTTLQERNFIDQTVFSYDRANGTFLGGSDAYQEGVWRWVTGPEGLQDGGKGLIFFDSMSRIDIPTNDMWIRGSYYGKIDGDSSNNNFLYMYWWGEPRFYPWNNSIGSAAEGGTGGYVVEYSASYRPIYLSGTLSGLDAGQTITLSNNGNDPITLSANGAFNFTKPISAGTTYSVSIQQEPNYKLCKVTQGSGTAASNVTNINVECLTPMVTTLAGSGVSGSTDGVGTSASFNYPWGIITDSLGNIFVSESGNDLIRKIDSSGNVVTFAGTKGTRNGEGSFYHPMGIAIDKNRNLYIADFGHDAVKRISPSGVVSIFAGSGLPKNFAGPPTWGSTDGEGNNATFNNPSGVAIDKNGYIYVADVNNQLIRKISPNSQVSTIAGTSGKTGNLNGQGVAASFANPFSVAVDTNGLVYVADTINNRIRKITPSGVVSDFASIKFPRSVATDSFDNVYVISDEQSKIYKVTPSGNIITLAGTEIGDLDGLARNAAFSSPGGVTVDLQGNILVSDTGNHKIRKITFVKP